MTRPLGTVLALALCASVVAGCGGSSPRAVAYKEAKYSGVPHSTVARIETVQIERPRWTMVWMKGRSAFPYRCPSTNPLGSQPCDARYLVIGIKQGTHDTGLGYALTSSQVAAITSARQASPRFRIFPDFMGIGVHCSIPNGSNPGGTPPGSTVSAAALAGICSTVTASVNHVRRVEFIEGWSEHKAGWVVTLNRDGRVQTVKATGRPPQLWK